MEAKKRTVFSHADWLTRAVLLGVLSSSQLANSAITVIQDNRSVSWVWAESDSDGHEDDGDYDTGIDTPPAGSSHWVNPTSSYYVNSGWLRGLNDIALQDSLITPNSMSGTGVSFVYYVPDGSIRNDSENSSTFDVTFSVDTLTSIDLFGSLWMPPTGFEGSTSADVTLYQGDEAIDSAILFQQGDIFELYIENNMQFATAPIDFLFQDDLSVGMYRLVIDAGSDRNRYIGETYWNFEANFTPTTVPLPAAFGLFSFALIGLVGVKRKNNSVVHNTSHSRTG